MKKRKVLNLTQHKVTEKQREMGVEEPDEETKELIRELITYDEMPTSQEVMRRCDYLVILASNYFHRYLHKIDRSTEKTPQMGVLLGGANFSNPVVEKIFLHENLPVYYSFSPRKAKEKMLPNDTVKTEYIFDFQGLIKKEVSEDGSVHMKTIKYGEDEKNDDHNHDQSNNSFIR